MEELDRDGSVLYKAYQHKCDMSAPSGPRCRMLGMSVSTAVSDPERTCDLVGRDSTVENARIASLMGAAAG